MENIISVKDMTFEYVSIDSKFRAIDNLNLEVKVKKDGYSAPSEALTDNFKLVLKLKK